MLLLLRKLRCLANTFLYLSKSLKILQIFISNDSGSFKIWCIIIKAIVVSYSFNETLALSICYKKHSLKLEEVMRKVSRKFSENTEQ